MGDVDTTGPDRARRAPTLADVLRDGNIAFAAVALVASGNHLSFGWREFWLPFAGGLVWTAGNYSAFRASEAIGLARAAGSWTPLNIIAAFAWGALLFGELDSFSAARFALVASALVLVLVGVLLIVSSQDERPAKALVPGAVPASGRKPAGPTSAGQATATSTNAGSYRGGLLWASAAGVLWGSYFVPAQWAKVPTQVANFPLALGILTAGFALALPAAEPVAVRHRQPGPAWPGLPGGHRCRLHHRPAEPARQCKHRHLGLQSAKTGLPGREHRSCRHPGRRCWWWANRGCEVAPDHSLPSYITSRTCSSACASSESRNDGSRNCLNRYASTTIRAK